MTGSRTSASRAPARASSNLPAHLPSIIGRDDAVTTVRERLMQAEAGLLTLTGAGGCGKTSLALHVARTLVDLFADGVWMVELAPLSEPTLVNHAVARPWACARIGPAADEAGQCTR